MTWGAVGLGVVSVISTGISAYSSLSNAGAGRIDGMDMVNYYYYDSDGNLTNSQVWDSKKKGYVYTESLSDEEKAERKKMSALREELLNNLSETPSDRIQAYNDYASAFSSQMHKNVDEQYDKLKTSSEESMAAKGMLGSKAYADTMAELNSDKLDLDTDIAQKATLAREELADADRTYWLNALTSLDNSDNADQALSLQRQQTSMQAASAGSSALAAKNQLETSSKLTAWQAKQEALNNMSSNLTSTATGLAFLYGYKNPKTAAAT